MAATTPTRAAAIVDGIGVNTHLHWRASDSAYANLDAVKNAISYLGVNHLRDAAPTEGWTMPIYRELAAQGISFNILATAPEFSANGNYALDVARIETLLKSNPSSVSSIEGVNEINRFSVSYNGKTTLNDLSIGRGIQSTLYNEVNARPALKDIPVLNLTTGGLNEKEAASLGNMSSFADYGNWHVYFGNGDQPGKNVASGIAAAKSLAPSDPVMITEANYYTAVDAMEWGGGGVTEAVQATLNLNMIMDSMYFGAERVFLYELMDNSLKPGATQTVEGSLGLFHNDGSPKQTATAIRNLIDILGDDAGNATSFTTQALDYTLSGMPSTGRSMLFQESNGKYDIVVWAEPDIWNEKSRSAIAAPSSSVTVSLAGTAGVVNVYDPLKGGTPIATYSNTGKITLGISDHPLIVEVAGLAKDASTAPVSPPVQTGLTQTIGSGSDSLVIKLSQDAWNGDAQYVVFVDGQRIGGALSAQSTRGSGLIDTLTVKGDWSAGQHKAEVRFINDAWGGTPSTDRNLFIEGASYDGADIAGAARDLLGPGSATFTFTNTDNDGGRYDFTVDANTALSGGAGAQIWGGIGVAAKDWNGSTVTATKSGDGLGVQGGRFGNQIDHNQATGKSESITLDFGRDVDYAALRLSRMSPSENGSPERAAWKAYTANGSVVGEGVFDPREVSPASFMNYDFQLNPASDFAKLELSGVSYVNAGSAADSSDFALARVAYHTVEAVF